MKVSFGSTLTSWTTRFFRKPDGMRALGAMRAMCAMGAMGAMRAMRDAASRRRRWRVIEARHLAQTTCFSAQIALVLFLSVSAVSCGDSGQHTPASAERPLTVAAPESSDAIRVGAKSVPVPASERNPADSAYIVRADAERGRLAMTTHNCGACHRIDGVPNAIGNVGPVLNGIARRVMIAGALVNTPANMTRWLLDPPSVTPHTAMPRLGLSEGVAADMAAYLETLK